MINHRVSVHACVSAVFASVIFVQLCTATAQTSSLVDKKTSQTSLNAVVIYSGRLDVGDAAGSITNLSGFVIDPD
jgi:hypothetical protein